MGIGRALVVVNALLAGILACSLPAGQGAAQPPDLAGTIAARATTPVRSGDTPVFPASTPFTQTSPPTLTPSVPQVIITVTADCRAGPGISYAVLYTLQPGQTAQIAGKDGLGNYWVIRMAGRSNCWLGVQDAAVSGDVSALPEVPSPATPIASPPANPVALRAAYSCKKSVNPFPHNDVHVTLTWQDNANDEDGYYVFRDNALVASLSAGATSFTDDTTMAAVTLPGDPAPHITYAIQAFSSAGQSMKISKSISCFD